MHAYVFWFDDESRAALAAAGISRESAEHVLYSSPQLRRYSDDVVLTISGPDQGGEWISVVSTEEDDDHYLVLGAYRLSAIEAEWIRKRMEG